MPGARDILSSFIPDARDRKTTSVDANFLLPFMNEETDVQSHPQTLGETGKESDLLPVPSGEIRQGRQIQGEGWSQRAFPTEGPAKVTLPCRLSTWILTAGHPSVQTI